MNYKELSTKFKTLLSNHKRVTIVSHIRPDGDTICSALAIYNLLKQERITSELVCKDSDIPFKFSFLNGFERFKRKIDYTDSLIIVVDCAEISRTGFELEGREIVNIDHHKSNSYFGKLNVVALEASATTVVYKLLKENFKIPIESSKALYAGLLTDSQNFTTSLTTKESFKVAQELLELGVNLTEISNQVNKNDTLAHVRVLARAINSLRLYNNGTVAIMEITQDDIKATGAKYSDINGVIDSAISLATVEIAILLVELNGNIKGSIRSKNVDISKLASSFNGGGHKNAAGFEAKEGKISKVKDDILRELKDYK